MKEFIEFDGDEKRKFAIRSGYVMWVRKPFNPVESDGTCIHVDDGSNVGEDFITTESYDQVIAKLEASEHVKMPIAERFTKEEYKLLNKALYNLLYGGTIERNQALLELHKKLQDVVRESEEE